MKIHKQYDIISKYEYKIEFYIIWIIHQLFIQYKALSIIYIIKFH